MQIVKLKTADLAPNTGQVPGLPTNPRQWTSTDIDKIAASLRETPELFEARPVLVIPHGGKYVILGGNLRYEGARKNKEKEVPAIIFPEDTPPEKLREIVVKDNGSFGAWDYDALANEWDSLPLTEWGVPAWNTEQTQEDADAPETQEDDFDEDADAVETRCKPGDVWELGAHRLMCGDSTDAEQVAKLMNWEKADLVFTDPPYGMKKENEGVLNDNLNQEDLLLFNKKWIPITFSNLKEDGSWYCWGTDEPLMDIYATILRPLIEKREILFRNLITWDKGNGQGQLSADFRMYPVADEKCLFVMMGRERFDFIDVPAKKWLKEQFRLCGMTNELSKKLTGRSDFSHWFREDGNGFTIIPEDAYEKLTKYYNGEFFTKPYNDIQKSCENARKDWMSRRSFFDNTHDNMNNVWHFDRTSKEERELTGGHATPKPLALCARGIKTSCKEGGLVLDVFGGSGSTLIACEQLGRKARLMELDPHYCDVILARWEKLTGQTAHKINQ